MVSVMTSTLVGNWETDFKRLCVNLGKLFRGAIIILETSSFWSLLYIKRKSVITNNVVVGECKKMHEVTPPLLSRKCQTAALEEVNKEVRKTDKKIVVQSCCCSYFFLHFFDIKDDWKWLLLKGNCLNGFRHIWASQKIHGFYDISESALNLGPKFYILCVSTFVESYRRHRMSRGAQLGDKASGTTTFCSSH